MTELIEAIRTARKVGTGEQDDIVHEHIQFFTPGGVLLTESCTLGEQCEWTKKGDPTVLVDHD